MDISKIIIHELIKQQKVLEASVFLSSEYLAKNAKSDRLGLTLNNSFSKDDITHGIFKEEGNEFFYHFNEYKDSSDQEAFLKFSSTVTEELGARIADQYWAKGGFLVYAEYRINNTRFVSVYLIRDVEGVLFEKDEDEHTFKINTTQYLDTNKLAMGCRINIDKLENHDSNHLTLIKKGQADISEYFVNWIGVDKPESNKEFTERLFNMISELPTAINPDTDLPFDLNVMLDLAHQNIKASPNKMINLRQLGLQLYGNDEILLDYAQENQIAIDSEFRYDTRALGKFKKIEVNRDGIRLTFSRGDAKSKVKLSEENPNQIIIESPQFAAAMRAQIETEDETA